MLLKNCTLRDQGTDRVADILVEKGIITHIGKIDHATDSIIDLHGKRVLPGIIDPHVHFREPGLTHKEDFRSGSFAAAAGGITTVLDMPNTLPPTTTVALLEAKRRLARASVVNYGFHFAATSDNIEEIKRARNIASVKVFMNVTTGTLVMTDTKAQRRVFSNTRLVSVHAEGDMVRQAVECSAAASNELYLCHIALASEMEYLQKHKSDRMHIEVTPHHLFLDESDDVDGYTKMRPTLKSASDQKALWQEISGLIDTIGSDHAPHTRAEKQGSEPAYGVPGCETLLPLLLDAVNAGRLTIDNVIRLCCENPARIFRMKNKGRCAIGYDADLTVVDMELEQKVDERRLFTTCGWSPFQGRRLRGWPVMTIVNGSIVYQDGKICAAQTGREVEFDEGTRRRDTT
jgi:dihydroorotase